MKRAFLAATALIFSSFTPVALPVLVAPAAAEHLSYEDLQDMCEEAAPTFGNDKTLPNSRWSWDPRPVEAGTSGGEDGDLIGFSMNPASRTIHAILGAGEATVVFNLDCFAVNPGDNEVPRFMFTIEEAFVEEGVPVAGGRPAVCNPGTGRTAATWKTPAGTKYILDDAQTNCDNLAAGTGPYTPLLDWNSLNDERAAQNRA